MIVRTSIGNTATNVNATRTAGNDSVTVQPNIHLFGDTVQGQSADPGLDFAVSALPTDQQNYYYFPYTSTMTLRNSGEMSVAKKG